jgi:hypothetical protein
MIWVFIDKSKATCKGIIDNRYMRTNVKKLHFKFNIDGNEGYISKNKTYSKQVLTL